MALQVHRAADLHGFESSDDGASAALFGTRCNLRRSVLRSYGSVSCQTPEHRSSGDPGGGAMMMPEEEPLVEGDEELRAESGRRRVHRRGSAFARAGFLYGHRCCSSLPSRPAAHRRPRRLSRPPRRRRRRRRSRCRIRGRRRSRPVRPMPRPSRSRSMRTWRGMAPTPRPPRRGAQPPTSPTIRPLTSSGSGGPVPGGCAPHDVLRHRIRLGRTRLGRTSGVLWPLQQWPGHRHQSGYLRSGRRLIAAAPGVHRIL